MLDVKEIFKGLVKGNIKRMSLSLEPEEESPKQRKLRLQVDFKDESQLTYGVPQRKKQTSNAKGNKNI